MPDPNEPPAVLPADPRISFRKLACVWEARQDGADILGELVQREPSVQLLLQSLADHCPVARSSQPFQGTVYSRPLGHARSFLLHTLSQGSVIFKGTEPLSEDCAAPLQEAWEQRPLFEWSRLEHFTLVESEVFLGLTLDNALFCARQTHQFAVDYFRRFRRLPRTPFPLAVFALPGELAEAYLTVLRPFLSDRGQVSALKRTEQLVREGLGIYAYYYPGLPIRAAHAVGSFPFTQGRGKPELTGTDAFDLDRAIEGWLDLFADMLAVSYLPTAVLHTGNCMQIQNLVIDGGACDLDSLEPMSRVKNDRDFLGALYYSVSTLADSIGSLVARGDELAARMVWSGVWHELCQRVAVRVKGTDADPRLLKAMSRQGLSMLRALSEAL